MGDEQLNWIRRVVESGARIRLAPGVIGKSATIMLGTMAVWMVAIWRSSPTAAWEYNAMLFGSALIVSCFAMRELHKMRVFAEKNPVTAMMEGADITEHRRVEAQAQAKGFIGADTSPVVEGPFPHVLGSGDARGRAL